MVCGTLEEETGGPFGLCGFEQTSSRTCPPLHTDVRCGLANPVGHTGTVVHLQRIERPIRIGHHPDASLFRDQNRHVRGGVACLDHAFSSFEQLHRVIHKSAHNLLIAMERRSLNLIWPRSGIIPRALPEAVY